MRAVTDEVGSSATFGVAFLLLVGFGLGSCVGSGSAVGVGDGSGVGFVSVGGGGPVFVLAVTSPLTGSVVAPLTGSGVEDSLDGSVEVRVLVVVVVVVLVSVDPLSVDSVVGDASDDGGFEVVSSADATPYPVAIAVPTPSA